MWICYVLKPEPINKVSIGASTDLADCCYPGLTSLLFTPKTIAKISLGLDKLKN